MKTIALHFVLALFASHVAFGKAAGLSRDAFEKADLIVHVRVTDDLDLMPRPTLEQLKDPNFVVYPEKFKNWREYRKIATASCVQVFKGADSLKTIKIRHTNGAGCPNAIYRIGEEYIVFLKKHAEDDTYVTMSYYEGQFPVREGEVALFYLMPGYRFPEKTKFTCEQVAAYLKEAVAKAAIRSDAAGKSD